MHDIDDHDAPTTIPGLLVFRYDAPLVLPERIRLSSTRSRARTGYRVVILNMEANVELDTTALNILKELHDRLAAHDIDLWLARVKNDVLIPMKNHGVAAVIDEENMYPTLPTAVDEYYRQYPN